jgi:putative transposase
VLNRANDRRALFKKPADYEAFLQLLEQSLSQANIELFGFCLMPNHWHLAVRPKGDRDMARFMSWLTNTHVKRYRAHYTSGSGHLYQGRYKSFPVQTDEYFLTLMRYIEANAVRPTMVNRVQDWPWSSATISASLAGKLLSPWPVERPKNWTAVLNRAMDESQVSAIRTSIERDRPFGSIAWVKRTAERMGLQWTIRPRGRPRKSGKA